LDQAEAVAERIGQNGDLAPGVYLDWRLDLRTGREGALDHNPDVVNDHVEVHGRPVPCVLAPIAASANRAGRLFQEVEPDRQAVSCACCVVWRCRHCLRSSGSKDRALSTSKQRLFDTCDVMQSPQS
jgi:hypothetical protein